MPKKEDYNVRLSKLTENVRDRILERVHNLEASIASPLSHYGKMTKAERHQLFAQAERTQGLGWGMMLDEQAKLAGITDQGAPKNVIDFAKQTMREMREGLEDAT